MPRENGRSLRRRVFISGLTGAATAGLAGCLGDDEIVGDDDDEVIPEDREIQPEFHTATESEATDLHLYHVNDVHSAFRVETVLDGAYTLDMDDEFYPGWVREIDNIDDQEYVYTLYDNLEWGGGYGQMTAHDWEFHWEAIMKQAAVEGNNWVAHASFADWAAIDTLEAEDDLTFRVELHNPDPLWIQTPAIWGEQIYPAELVEPYWEAHQDGDEEAGMDLAENEEILNFEYTGNLGPYSFEERLPEDRWVATRNEDYYRRGREPDADLWEDAPYFEEYTIHTIEEQSTRMAELETEALSGLTTASPVPPDEVPSVEDWDHIDLYNVESPFSFHTAYNQRANGWEPFRNREVRRAFSKAIDKEVINEDIYHGAAEPGQTFQPEWSDFYNDDEVEAFGVGDTYDPEGARTTLEEELPQYGYEYDGDDLIDADGNQVELTLVHRERHGPEADTGVYHAEQYENELGISINREQVPTTVFFDEYMDQEDEDGNLLPNAGPRDEAVSRRDWDIMWSLGLNTFPRSPMLVDLFWGRDAPFNYMGWHEPEGYDISEMLEGVGDDLDEMQEVLGEIFGLISREQPANFVQFTFDMAGYHETVVPSPEEQDRQEFGWGYLSTTWHKTDDPFA